MFTDFVVIKDASGVISHQQLPGYVTMRMTAQQTNSSWRMSGSNYETCDSTHSDENTTSTDQRSLQGHHFQVNSPSQQNRNRNKDENWNADSNHTEKFESSTFSDERGLYDADVSENMSKSTEPTTTTTTATTTSGRDMQTSENKQSQQGDDMVMQKATNVFLKDERGICNHYLMV